MEGKRRVGKRGRAEGSPGEGSKTTGDYRGSHIAVPEAAKLMCSRQEYPQVHISLIINRNKALRGPGSLFISFIN